MISIVDKKGIPFFGNLRRCISKEKKKRYLERRDDYREKDGGARLEEVWHASIEGCAKWGSVMSAMGLSSA